MPASTFKAELARILREQGYIEDFSVEPGRVGHELRVRLKYTEDRRSVIQGLERISKPGRRGTWAPAACPRCRAAWAPRSSRPPAA